MNFYRFERRENDAACQIEPLTDDSMVDKPQTVTISWENEDIADAVTEFMFTYKPDPDILSIYPNITIVE